MYSKKKSSRQQRVELSKKILQKILERISSGRVSELADDIGLPTLAERAGFTISHQEIFNTRHYRGYEPVYSYYRGLRDAVPLRLKSDPVTFFLTQAQRGYTK